MAVPESPPAERRAIERAAWRGTAFGLTVEAPSPLPGLPAGRAADGGRRVTWTGASFEEIAEASPTPDGVPLVDLRHMDGRAFMTVERDSTGTYRISAPGFGVHLVAADGSSIRSSLPERGARRWQRLFFAQALPLAAALNGLELFHASAVEIGGRAVAFSGAPGTGKTSIAMHLVAQGARFVTDDVLAVERDAASVRVHPGPALANVEARELVVLGPGECVRLAGSDAPGEDGKRVVETAPVRTPLLVLGAVCFLARVPEEEPLELRREPPGRIRTLLGSGFLPYLRSPARLATHLDVCAHVAASSVIYQLRIPTGTSARETAEFVQGHLTATAPW